MLPLPHSLLYASFRIGIYIHHFHVPKGCLSPRPNRQRGRTARSRRFGIPAPPPCAARDLAAGFRRPTPAIPAPPLVDGPPIRLRGIPAICGSGSELPGQRGHARRTDDAEVLAGPRGRGQAATRGCDRDHRTSARHSFAEIVRPILDRLDKMERSSASGASLVTPAAPVWVQQGMTGVWVGSTASARPSSEGTDERKLSPKCHGC